MEKEIVVDFIDVVEDVVVDEVVVVIVGDVDVVRDLNLRH